MAKGTESEKADAGSRVVLRSTKSLSEKPKAHPPGWGRRAFAALERNDYEEIHNACLYGTFTKDDITTRARMKVKGGFSFYYDDYRVSGGKEKVVFPPRPGDTLLHVALRHHRSARIIATLLQLGSDPMQENYAGEAAIDVNPPLYQFGLEMYRKMKDDETSVSTSTTNGSEMQDYSKNNKEVNQRVRV